MTSGFDAHGFNRDEQGSADVSSEADRQPAGPRASRQGLAQAWFSPVWTTELPVRLLAAFEQALPADGAALLFAADTPRLSLQALCASPGLAMRIEDLQLVVGESPATRAFHDGRPVLVPLLGAPDERWPAFTSEVYADRESAMFAFPLDVGRLRIGVLDLYRHRSGPISTADAAAATRAGAVLAESLLEITSAAAAQNSTESSVEPWADERAPVILLSRATAMVAAQLRVSGDEAGVRLRAHAFASSRSLADVVDAVIAGDLLLER